MSERRGQTGRPATSEELKVLSGLPSALAGAALLEYRTQERPVKRLVEIVQGMQQVDLEAEIGVVEDVSRGGDSNAPYWWLRAACRGMDTSIFYPEKDRKANDAHAKRICQACPVKDQCLKYALETGEKHGTWGGMTTTERNNYRRRSRVV